MKPEEALEILDKAAAQVSSNRAGHEAIRQAVETLSALIRSVHATAK